jgi:hypothetical protein
VFFDKRSSALGKLSEFKILELVKQYIQDSVARWDKKYIDVTRDDHPPPYVDGSTFYSYYSELGRLKNELIANMKRGDYSMLETPVTHLLKKNGIDADKNSLEYRKFCIAIHEAEIKLLPLEQRHMIRDLSYKDELPQIFSGVFSRSKKIPQAEDGHSEELLSEIIDKYAAEAKANWNEKTESEVMSALQLLLDILGDVPIQSIDKRRMMKVKETIAKLPKHMKKKPEYREKTIAEILAMAIPETLSRTTIKNKLQKISTFFEYATKNGLYEGPNPVVGLTPYDS